MPDDTRLSDLTEAIRAITEALNSDADRYELLAARLKNAEAHIATVNEWAEQARKERLGVIKARDDYMRCAERALQVMLSVPDTRADAKELIEEYSIELDDEVAAQERDESEYWRSVGDEFRRHK